MKNILIVFAVLLFLLTLLSSFGGSIRPSEPFYEEASAPMVSEIDRLKEQELALQRQLDQLNALNTQLSTMSGATPTMPIAAATAPTPTTGSMPMMPSSSNMVPPTYNPSEATMPAMQTMPTMPTMQTMPATPTTVPMVPIAGASNMPIIEKFEVPEPFNGTEFMSF
jgi:hypothetical protein